MFSPDETLILVNRFVKGRHVPVTSPRSLHAKRLRVRLPARRQRGDIRSRLNETASSPTEPAATTTTTARRLHPDEIPDLLLRGLRRTTSSTTSRKRRCNPFGGRIGYRARPRSTSSTASGATPTSGCRRRLCRPRAEGVPLRHRMLASRLRASTPATAASEETTSRRIVRDAHDATHGVECRGVIIRFGEGIQHHRRTHFQ